MSQKITNIFQQKIKPKEKINLLVDGLSEGDFTLADLVSYYPEASDSEKGSLLSALAEITKESPEFVEGKVDFIIDQLPSKAPRIKWEAGEILANIAPRYPKKVAKAVPALLDNTKDKGTVVRWSAAFALTELVKANSEVEKQLVPKFRKMIDDETNNGVKKFYIKTLQKLKI